MGSTVVHSMGLINIVVILTLNCDWLKSLIGLITTFGGMVIALG